MGFFHVYIKYKKALQDEIHAKSNITFNLSEDILTSGITNPYNEGKAFQFAGRTILPSQVDVIHVFFSETSLREIILTDGKKVSETRKEYVVKRMLSKQVRNVSVYTPAYINPVWANQTSFSPNMTPNSKVKKDKVFIVHGRDDASAYKLKDHLGKKGMSAELFEDFKERITGNTTVIEELVKIKDQISYAFIIASADDLGTLAKT
jgi:hypothetical protein